MAHRGTINSQVSPVDEYVSLLSDVPRPSEQQINNFVKFVASAHSWYKHIPYHLPGVPFYFFVDPFAGCEVFISWMGKVTVAPRTEQGFHHSWIPTREYREQFGHLAYSCVKSTQATVLKWFGRTGSNDYSPTIRGRDGKLRALPTEVLDAGRVHLTAAIHTSSAGLPFWDIWNPGEPPENVWPESSGGSRALQKIVARCREMERLHSQGTYSFSRGTILFDTYQEDPNVQFVDRELYPLVAREQKRQHQEMAKSISRVCDLVWH